MCSLHKIVLKKAHTAIILIFLLATPLPLFAETKTTKAWPSVTIDLFTQKKPYDGRGINKSSDIFGPQETVKLYALVLECGNPLSAKLVTFEICKLNNTQLRFSRVSFTNSSGLAETYFSLHVISETEAFGTWYVLASVDVDGRTYRDSLYFEVYWLVELISVRTVDENPQNTTGPPPTRNYFGINGFVGVEIALRDNALTGKNVKITVVLYDELNVPVNTSYIENLILPPKKLVYIYQKLYMPKHAVPGKATIFVSALDENYLAYCPEVSTNFLITSKDPISPNFLDVSVYAIYVSSNYVEPGDNVDIQILVGNEGTETVKNVDVTLCINDTLMAKQQVQTLNPFEQIIFNFTWNTIGLSEDTYMFTANISLLKTEADLTDNMCNFSIEVKLKPRLRDVGVINVLALPSMAYIGDNIDVEVVAANFGDDAETFTITVYYNNTVIDSRVVWSLEPCKRIKLEFTWITTNLVEGKYLIWALAEILPGEIDVENNRYIGNEVKLISKPIVKICDLAITSVFAKPNVVTIGGIIQIEVNVANFGTSDESFNVLVCYDNILISTRQITDLPPKSERKLTIQWNTTCVREGTYTIKAYIPPLPCETNIENNLYINGNVTIKAPPPPPPPAKIHDIAIINVYFHPSRAYIGEVIDIWVEAANLGDYPETFNVKVYYNQSEIATQKIWLLQPGQKITLHFSWNTSNMMEGVYTIWAYAEPVPGEINTENNSYVGGNVTLIRRPPPPLVCDIAVIWLSANPQTVISGQKITIEAIVANLGDTPEDFNLTIFYDRTLILNMPLTLPAYTNKTVIYFWNTTNVAPGMYRLWANVTILECETDIENNKFEDGTITVMGIFPFYKLLILLIPLGLIAGMVAILFALSYIFIRRRRRKRKELKKSYAVIIHKHI